MVQAIDLWDSMDESQRHYSKWIEPLSKGCVVSVSSLMLYFEKGTIKTIGIECKSTLCSF